MALTLATIRIKIIVVIKSIPFVSSWVRPGTGDGPVLELELLFRGLSGDLRLPESLLSLERTEEAALLESLEAEGLSFSWWEESSRDSPGSGEALRFSSRGALLDTCTYMYNIIIFNAQ